MADYVRKFEPGQAVTFTAASTVIGGRVVQVAGNRAVATATAASTYAIGVAARDAATGDSVVVYLAGPVDRVPCAAAVAAGSTVEAAASGKVQTRTTGNALGIALNATTAADQIVEFVRI